jgi:hypothetical protein
VDQELDERLPAIVRPEVQAAVDAHVRERMRELKLERNRATAAR